MFQPTPTPSNPQHNPERPNPTKKGTRPSPPTDREGFREGRESPGREKTQPDPREPDPHSQRTERGSERTVRVRLGRVRTREDPTRPRKPDPHSQRTERGSEKGRVILGESGREKTQPDQGNQTPTPNGQRGIQRGERVRLGGVMTRGLGDDSDFGG